MTLPVAEQITATNLEDLNAKFKSKLHEAWSANQGDSSAIEKYFLLNLAGGVQTAVKVALIPGQAPEIWAKNLRQLSPVIPLISNGINEFIESVSNTADNVSGHYHDLHFVDGDNLIKLAATQGGILPPAAENPLEDALEKLQSKKASVRAPVVEKKPEVVAIPPAAVEKAKSHSMFGWMTKFSNPGSSKPAVEEQPKLRDQGPKSGR